MANDSFDLLEQLGDPRKVDALKDGIERKRRDDVVGQLDRIEADIEQAVKNNRSTEEVVRDIIQSNFRCLNEDVENTEKDLNELMLHLRAMLDSCGGEFAQLQELNESEQAIVDRAKAAYAKAEKALEKAEDLPDLANLLFGMKNRRIRKTTAEVEEALTEIKQAEEEANKMYRDRLKSADIGDSLDRIIRWAGVVFPRPVFGGVLVIEPREPGTLPVLERVFLGRGTWYAPEAVRSTPWLAGQNLVPERASRFSAESFRFHRGFLAPFPGYREGDIRIPEHPGDHNAMPYVTWCGFRGASERAADGLYHYFGMEPYETGKQGLNLSLFLPADGAPTVYYVDHARAESGLFGSSAVAVKVRESRKNFDWDQNAAVESRPYIRDVGGERRFFWLTTVVTKDDRAGERFIGGSIPDVTLTDARYRQVVWIDRDRVGDPAAWPAQLERELAPVWGLPPANADPAATVPDGGVPAAPADTATAGSDTIMWQALRP